MADQKFSFPDQIDMLLDANLFWNLILLSQGSLERDIILQNIQLGWLVGGCIPCSDGNEVFCNLSMKFWGLVESFEKLVRSPEEVAYNEHYNKHTQHLTDGRLVMTIPFRDD